MSTPALEAPPASLPIPDATCAEVQAIMDGAARRVEAKDLNGAFRIVGGSLRAGAVHIAYTKDGFSRPCYHLSAERGEGGRWSARCSCLGHEHAGHCKHAVRAALALPTWPDETCELMRLLLGDDGRRAVCSYCDTGTMMSVNWRRQSGPDCLTWICSDCGHRTTF